ncbi:MAG: right-handed parallel beta-helix repeat-containing protein [Planctomycetes bacterium]|nr:right-handed parallel beta-helix repeat-containing protein [Planctomycetota bacterium]
MSNVQRFGATGDGVTDDTEAIQHAIRDGDGVLHFPPGSYRITQPIEIDLAQSGPLGIDGTSGTARVLMTGPGPAFRLIGTHGGTGDPTSVKGNVYPNQRLPTIKNIEVEGAHPEADGIELIQTLQSVIEGVLVRRCRHGIRLTQRNRNVLISHCHIYYNTGVGIFLDQVNLHQIIIASSHISYNRLGGIRIEGSEIRNLQITGNDIEYNNHAQHDMDAEPTAEIFVDTTAPGSSVNEVTIASNTIQATLSPGGCNIRILETADGSSRPPGLWSITGNIIGSQENNVHLTGCYGVSLSGNCIYSCGNRNLLIEDSRQINVGTNTFRRHTPRMGTGIRIVRSADVTITGCSILDEHPDGQPSGAALMDLVASQRINVSGCQLLDGVPCGIDATDCSHVSITGCTIHDTREERKSEHAIRFTGQGKGNLVGMNSIGPTIMSTFVLDEAAGVTVDGNVVES